MSEVRMSLEEYDQIVQKSNLYQEIVEAITNVCCSQYEIESYKEGVSRFINVRTESIELSPRARQLIHRLIQDNVNRIIRFENLKDYRYDEDISIRVDCGYIERNEDDVKDGD